MTGRGTVIAKAHDPGQLLAVKIYWPEAHRPKENYLITFTRDISQGDSDITNHLPTVFASQDLDKTSPSGTRLVWKQDTPEYCVSLPLPTYLNPVTTLSKEEFVRAWLDCVRCRCH